MPRFVILRHETPPGYERPTHFDLMLEWGDALRTWALPAFPQVGKSVEAEELAPHRRAYLDFEGEVSAGRGTVTRTAAGEYELLESAPDLVCLQLTSPELAGTLRMVRLSRDAALWSAALSAQ
jgi:DNA polymerase ligase (LigD)-like protein